MVQIDTVIFDYDGVIRHLDMKHIAEVLKPYDLDPKTFFSLIWTESVHKLIEGKIDRTTWWQGLQADHDILKGLDNEFLWNRVFSSNIFNIHLLDFVSELNENSQHRITTVILSNADNISKIQIIEEMKPYKFDHVFTSSDFGVSKPNKAIFLQILDILGKKPRECLFIDDSKKNVDAAYEIGLNSHYIRPEDTFDKPVEIIKSYLPL